MTVDIIPCFYAVTSQVTVSRDGSCAQYGMIAVDDIESGTTLFEIPRPMLLSSETSEIATLLQDGKFAE